MEKVTLKSEIMKDSPFSSDFQSAVRLLYSQGEAFILQENKKEKKRLIERQWWGDKEKREQSTLLPSPFLCFVNFYSPCFKVWRHTKEDQSELSDIPVFLPWLLPFPYLSPATTFSRVYNVLPESQQCTAKQQEREGRKRKVWVDFSADLEAFIWHAPVIFFRLT